MPHRPVLTEETAGSAQARPFGFTCSTEIGGRHAAWIHMRGDLDISTSAQLAKALRRSLSWLVVVDLRELTFIDLCGVRMIVDAAAAARRAGRRLIVLRGTPEVDRLFTLTATDTHVEIVDLHPFEPAIQVLLHLAEDEPDARA
jgi:anti-anti-sigma factor